MWPGQHASQPTTPHRESLRGSVYLYFCHKGDTAMLNSVYNTDPWILSCSYCPSELRAEFISSRRHSSWWLHIVIEACETFTAVSSLLIRSQRALLQAVTLAIQVSRWHNLISTRTACLFVLNLPSSGCPTMLYLYEKLKSKVTPVFN
jgi:hypothetical protein